MTYLYSLGVTFDVLALLGATVLYLKYISKLRESHPKIYGNLLAILVVFTICICAFALLFSMYLDSPKESSDMLTYSLIPYYLAIILWTSFFIYISPGLVDKVNGIPKYQYFLYWVYTIILLAYPLLFILFVAP